MGTCLGRSTLAFLTVAHFLRVGFSLRRRSGESAWHHASEFDPDGALMHKPRVLLADDSDRFLNVASRLLGADCEIVATACDGDCALKAVNQFKPDLVVLDINMPGTDGMQAARQLQKLGPTPRIVFLTVHEDPDIVQAACAMGASYVVKARMYSDLLVAIKEALAGRVFVSSGLMDRHTRSGVR